MVVFITVTQKGTYKALTLVPGMEKGCNKYLL